MEKNSPLVKSKSLNDLPNATPQVENEILPTGIDQSENIKYEVIDGKKEISYYKHTLLNDPQPINDKGALSESPPVNQWTTGNLAKKVSDKRWFAQNENQYAEKIRQQTLFGLINILNENLKYDDVTEEEILLTTKSKIPITSIKSLYKTKRNIFVLNLKNKGVARSL